MTKKMNMLYNINDRQRIGTRIRDLRQKRNISTYQLEKLTGIQASNITQIEKGRYSTGLDILAKIAAALGCDLDFVENEKAEP